MKEYNITKRLQSKNYKEGRSSLISSMVFRSSYSKIHNGDFPEFRLENLFNFSPWFGSPSNDKISSEIFIYHHKGILLPRIKLINWKKKQEKMKLE